MTTETILTEARMRLVQSNRPSLAPFFERANTTDLLYFARAIEQALLQSPEIQALRKDAELFQFLLEEAWFQRAFDRFDPDDNGDQSKFESECRRILIAAMEQQK